MKKFIGLALAALISLVSGVPALAQADTTLLQYGSQGHVPVKPLGEVVVGAGTVTGRQCFRVALSPNTGAAANGTVYKAVIFPGRAGSVSRVVVGNQVAPIGGTDTVKVLKNASNGNTMLGSSSLDATTLTNFTPAQQVLTSTAADLSLTAAQGIYLEYNQGTTTTAAQDISVLVEFTPTDNP